jgi:hypothetical protein
MTYSNCSRKLLWQEKQQEAEVNLINFFWLILGLMAMIYTWIHVPFEPSCSLFLFIWMFYLKIHYLFKFYWYHLPWLMIFIRYFACIFPILSVLLHDCIQSSPVFIHIGLCMLYFGFEQYFQSAAYPGEKLQTQPSCHLYLSDFHCCSFLLIAWQNIGLKYIISTFSILLAIFGRDRTNVTISVASSRFDL